MRPKPVFIAALLLFALAAVFVLLAWNAPKNLEGPEASGTPLSTSEVSWGGSCTQNESVAFSVKAVLEGRPVPEGCLERWAIMVPPAEKGNISAQAHWILSHSKLTGVFIDDFGMNSPQNQADMLASLSSFKGPVCPLVYDFDPQPNSTKGISCVLLAITPNAGAFQYATTHPNDTCAVDNCGPSLTQAVSSLSPADWYAVAGEAAARIDAKDVMILFYSMPYSGWHNAIPPNYVSGIRDYAQMNGLGWVVWK